MIFTTLLSGSSGNCIYIGSKNTHILIDAGCSMRYLKKSLAQISVDPEDISAILLTHEHSDHISGAAKISRKYNIPIYASPLTWENLPFFEDFLPNERHIFEYGMRIGDLSIDFFKLYHDAIQPVGIIVQDEISKIGIMTDTGKITSMMLKALCDVDAMIVEANYSVNMLNSGSYPAYLKKRISSDEGHLSNIQTGEALCRLISEKTKAIVLAHLSNNNNTPGLALSEVTQVLAKNGIVNYCTISVAPRFEPLPIIQL